MPETQTLVASLPFVYGLVDPIEPEHIRYIGLAFANLRRPFQHETAAKNSRTKPTYPICWIRKILSEGDTYDVVVLEQLESGTDKAEAGWQERFWILATRATKHKLTNCTDGGDGVLNPSAETRQKMCEAHEGRWTPEVRKLTGDKTRATMTPERRAEICKARAKQVISHSLETRQKMSDSWTPERRATSSANSPNKGRVRSQEIRDRISASRMGIEPWNKGKKMSAETCNKRRGRIPWNKGLKMVVQQGEL